MKWTITYRRNVDGVLVELSGFDMAECESIENILKGRFEYDKQVGE